MLRRAVLIALFTLLGACTAYSPVPKDYTGPVATLEDSAQQEDSNKARFFVVAAVDGNPIRTSIGATDAANRGRGFSVTPTTISRQVPVRPMKLSLRATHATGAPIHALASMAAGTFYSVEGDISFTPEANKRYVVRGELAKFGSKVWLEDAETGKPVSEIVTGPKP